MTKIRMTVAPAVTNSSDADFYGKLFWGAVIFFVAALAPIYLLVDNVHPLKEHEFALRIFLAIFFDFATTLITFLATVIIKAFAETFFEKNQRAFYFKVFGIVIAANIAVDVPTYQILGLYHFISEDDLLGRVALAVSLGGSAVFLSFIACMVSIAIIKTVFEIQPQQKK